MKLSAAAPRTDAVESFIRLPISEGGRDELQKTKITVRMKSETAPAARILSRLKIGRRVANVAGDSRKQTWPPPATLSRAPALGEGSADGQKGPQHLRVAHVDPDRCDRCAMTSSESSQPNERLTSWLAARGRAEPACLRPPMADSQETLPSPFPFS